LAAPAHVAAVRRFLFDALDSDQVSQLEAVSTAILGAIDEPSG
jgi:hypothetical protein